MIFRNGAAESLFRKKVTDRKWIVGEDVGKPIRRSWQKATILKQKVVCIKATFLMKHLMKKG